MNALERPIAKGDLVRVVRWPCCGAGLGMIDLVTGIRAPYTGAEATCSFCWSGHPGTGYLAATERGHVWPVAWLRRIPPLEELEEERSTEEIAA